MRNDSDVRTFKGDNERIVVVGAGSAGIGVTNSLAHTIIQENDLRPEEVFKK